MSSSAQRRRHSQWLVSLAAGAIGATVVGDGAGTQEFRASAQLVRVHATVRNADGRLVTGLDRNDFQIIDDGHPTDLALFSEDPQPLSVAVMLDTSFSMTGLGLKPEWREVLKTSVLEFVRALGPADRASLGTFGVEIAVGPAMTTSIVEFERVLLEEAWTGGGTPLWQAIEAATKSLAAESGRRVVLVYTDGFDSGGLPGWAGNVGTVEREALRTEVLLYVVRPSLGNGDRRLPNRIVELAAMTGGSYVEITMGTDLPGAFARLAEELRQQYLLGLYTSKRDGKVHNIEVRPRRPELRVRARQHYVAGDSR